MPFITLVGLARRSVAQARYLLLGTLFLLCGFQLVIVGQASAIEETQAFGRMAEFVPAFLQRGLGNRSLLLATFKGTVAFGYFHPVVAVLIAVVAIYFTTEPAHEVESGLVDLTLARSVPRHVIITRSLLLALSGVLLTTLMMGIGTRLGFFLFSRPTFDRLPVVTAAQLLVHLAAVAICFGAFGLAVAAGARRWSTAFTTATLTAVVLYLVDFLAIGWPLMRSVAWISPFHYYPALDIVAGDAPRFENLAILLSAASVLTIVAYWRFNRRDV